MGSGLNEMMPQPNSRRATTTTRKRLLSAKSTRPRIIARSLLHCVLQNEGVLDHALPRLNARPNLLHVAWEHGAAGHFHAPESPVFSGHVDPVAIVQMKDGGCGYQRMGFRLLSAEGGGDEHAESEEAGILDLEPHFGGAQVGIHDGAHVIDAPAQQAVGISVDMRSEERRVGKE